MTNEEEITCIVCPIGCKILLKKSENKIKILKGYKCKRGIEYAKNEALNPHRMLTTSVKVKNGDWPLVSVKSSKPIPKEKIFVVLNQVKKKYVNAPINLGDIIIKNISQTGINIVATKTIKKN